MCFIFVHSLFGFTTRYERVGVSVPIKNSLGIIEIIPRYLICTIYDWNLIWMDNSFPGKTAKLIVLYFLNQALLPIVSALSFADNIDAKMETVKELLHNVPDNNLEWQGFNRLLDTNIRRTSI